MGTTGVIIGVVLLALVTAVAFLLGRKAEANVEQFREEHHERFKGSDGRVSEVFSHWIVSLVS